MTIEASGGTAPVRYAVRQVLDQEYRKATMRKQTDAPPEASMVLPLIFEKTTSESIGLLRLC
jgi:hypothetical protein